MKYAEIIKRIIRGPSQVEPLDERQVQNNAGGFVFQIDDWARLDRFLILGSDAPTYYRTARALTRETAHVVERCYGFDPERTVRRIVDISDSGRAPKNDPAIFALAIGAALPDTDTRQRALAALPRVCRTATHLFQFVTAVRALGRGWGRSLKRAVAAWYDGKPADEVAFQAIKYRSREGYTHKRLLQTAHPHGDGAPVREALYRWICEKEHDAEVLPAVVRAHLESMASDDKGVWLRLIADYKLPWEALPTEANADPDVWRAMLPHLGLTALIRNLGNMTRVGAITPLSEAERIVVERLSDERALRKARLHPLAILQAHAVYRSGRGMRGSGTWSPSGLVLDALDRAFYKAFANVEPTGKRHLIGLDVSSSMGSTLMGSALSCREGSAAMALVTMAVEPQTHVVGFTGGGYGHQGSISPIEALTPLAISARQRLGDVISAISGLTFGNTDCALPMLYALEKRIPVDAFVIYTDNETWAGNVHPVAALRQYRQMMRIPAKLVVVGMTATGFSIADPSDGGMMDVVGFDASAPAVMADFVRGSLGSGVTDIRRA